MKLIFPKYVPTLPHPVERQPQESVLPFEQDRQMRSCVLTGRWEWNGRLDSVVKRRAEDGRAGRGTLRSTKRRVRQGYCERSTIEDLKETM